MIHFLKLNNFIKVNIYCILNVRSSQSYNFQNFDENGSFVIQRQKGLPNNETFVSNMYKNVLKGVNFF